MLTPVILSGGAGTRLWPLSRELYPKQLLPLTGERTHAAADGAAPRRAGAPARRSWCATRRTASWWPSSCGSCGSSRAPSCSSPSAATPRPPSRWRRTRPSKGLAATPTRSTRCCWCCRRTTSSATSPAFQQAVRVALAGGRGGAAGRPSASCRRAPETGYGYIQRGAAERRRRSASRASSRSPTRARARVRRLRRLLLEQRHVHVPRAPLPARSWSASRREIAQRLRRRLRGARSGPGLHAHRRRRRSRPAPPIRSTTRSWRRPRTPWSCRSMPAGATSAPGPRCTRRATPTRTATWRAATSSARTPQGCYLYSESRLVAAVGLKDHVVVETKDAVLVAPQGPGAGRARSWSRG